jgi:hypothetical protein
VSAANVDGGAEFALRLPGSPQAPVNEV